MEARSCVPVKPSVRTASGTTPRAGGPDKGRALLVPAFVGRKTFPRSLQPSQKELQGGWEGSDWHLLGWRSTREGGRAGPRGLHPAAPASLSHPGVGQPLLSPAVGAEPAWPASLPSSGSRRHGGVNGHPDCTETGKWAPRRTPLCFSHRNENRGLTKFSARCFS